MWYKKEHEQAHEVTVEDPSLFLYPTSPPYVITASIRQPNTTKYIIRKNLVKPYQKSYIIKQKTMEKGSTVCIHIS